MSAIAVRRGSTSTRTSDPCYVDIEVYAPVRYTSSTVPYTTYASASTYVEVGDQCSSSTLVVVELERSYGGSDWRVRDTDVVSDAPGGAGRVATAQDACNSLTGSYAWRNVTKSVNTISTWLTCS